MTTQSLRKTKVNLLETIENIIEITEDSKLDSKAFTTAKKDLQKLSRVFDLTTNQSLLFAVMVNFCSESRFRINRLTKFFDCKEIKLLRMENDFEVLKDRRLIRIRQDKKDTYYSVPNDVVVALKNNEIYEFFGDSAEISTLSDWFDKLEDLFSDFDEDEINLTHLEKRFGT